MNFRDLMTSSTGFVPRTQAQALQGFSEGVLGPEYYMYRAVNIHPILEEPWDTNEIDRLLAKPDLDEDTAVVLMTVFERMVRASDKELALFAAESINVLERRFLSRIQRLRKQLALKHAPGKPEESGDGGFRSLRGIIDSYRSLAKLCFRRPELKRFYLEEARRCHEDNVKILVDPDLDLAFYITILLDAGDLEPAAMVLVHALTKNTDSRHLHFLAARLSFMHGDFRKVLLNLENMPPAQEPDQWEDLQYFWTKRRCND
ncbi:MAG: hypothetical protein ABIJ86_14025, partial [Spirochaetota bacterium]